MNFDEHESAVVWKPMGSGIGDRERDATERLDRIGVELLVVGVRRQFIANSERLPRV